MLRRRFQQHPAAGLLLIAALFLIACSCGLPGLGGGGASVPEENPNLSGADLGEVVTAGAVGANNTPQDVRDDFSTDDPIIYVVADVERVEAGTTVFARWFREGEPFEDSLTITADREYTDTYLEFHLEPEQGQTLEALEPGEYSVQIYVNGNPGPSADFTVR